MYSIPIHPLLFLASVLIVVLGISILAFLIGYFCGRSTVAPRDYPHKRIVQKRKLKK